MGQHTELDSPHARPTPNVEHPAQVLVRCEAMLLVQGQKTQIILKVCKESAPSHTHVQAGRTTHPGALTLAGEWNFVSTGCQCILLADIAR